MCKEKIVILGSGGHAKIVVDIVEKMNKYFIAGVVSEDKNVSFCGYPILGDDSVLTELFKKGIRKSAMGVGGFKDNLLRKNIFLKVKKIGFKFVPAIDPTAIISKTASLGEGVVIFAGTIINTEVVIGNNVIIATGTTIDHETRIEDHVLISAGVTIGANDIIKEGSLLALGANIVSGITIGKNILIGAGATVIKNIDKTGIYVGVPAKRLE